MLVSLCGTWDMISNVNFDGYMIALGKCSKHGVPVKQLNFDVTRLHLYIELSEECVCCLWVTSCPGFVMCTVR